jgi:K+-sensing histidine kinase KdpD
VPENEFFGHHGLSNRSFIEPTFAIGHDMLRGVLVNRDIHVLIGYGVAVAAVAIALAIKYLFDELGSDHPFVLLPAAVMVAAWYGGRGPGLFAAVIAAVGADILFLPPAGIGVLRDDVFPLVALLVEAILIVEITVRLRRTRELARRDAASADLARREASLGMQMREELLTFLSTKLNRPLLGMVDGLISARSAVERGESTQAIAALDSLATEARVLQRATEYWASSAEAASQPHDD